METKLLLNNKENLLLQWACEGIRSAVINAQHFNPSLFPNFSNSNKPTQAQHIKLRELICDHKWPEVFNNQLFQDVIEKAKHLNLTEAGKYAIQNSLAVIDKFRTRVTENVKN